MQNSDGAVLIVVNNKRDRNNDSAAGRLRSADQCGRRP